MKKFLFIGAPLPSKAYGWIALFLRLFIGILMLTHAFPKIANYPTLSLTFPDPLGIGTAGYRKVPFRNSQLLVSAFASTDRAAADSCRRVLSRRNGELWVYEQR